jgi:hypothetical protein
MIIDLILDRYDDERRGDFDYNAHDFYIAAMGYGRIGDEITRAMDGGTEADTKNALCAYIDNNDYNPRIKDYINARVWNDNDKTKKPIVKIL